MRARTLWIPIVALMASGCRADHTAPAREPQAQPPAVFPSGGSTLVGLAALNLLGDSRLDLITVARGDNSIRVLPGNADGTFGDAQVFSGGDDLTHATAGDVNGDGIPDLLAVGHLSNALFVRLGLGGGQFAPLVKYPLRNHGNRLVVADLNRDGYADVVVSHDGSGAPIFVTAFLGSSTGELHSVWELGTSYFTTEDIATGDFDGDGKIDVAIAMNDNRAAVMVLRGLGTGAFAAPVFLPPLSESPGISDGTTGLAVGDVNRDGRDDIIVACFSLTNQLVIRLSTGASFTDPVSIPLTSPIDVALGDLDGDGKLDLIASNIESGSLSLLRGNGDGTFRTPVDVAIGPEPVSLAVADFDGDGLADVAVTSLADHAIRVLRGPALDNRAM
jgi:VCBS repeat protein